jgi:hypothetical protein
MVGTSGNRKVARAARTSSGRRRSASAPIGYYSTLVIIAILGSALVFFSRQERLDASNPGSTPPLAPAVKSDGTLERAGDNWFEAFGVYICDKYVPNIDSANNPYGINTQNDGIIHISPFEKRYAGHNATLGLFAKAVDFKVDRTSFKLPTEEKTWKSGEKCGDKNGKFVVKEWTSGKDNATGKEVKSDPARLLLKDGAAIAVAYIPDDMKWEDIPLPDSAAKLEEVKAKAQAEAAAPEEGASDAPADPTATTAPAATPPVTDPTATTAPPAP